jgi:RNA ligase (TIGR02306 family)
VPTELAPFLSKGKEPREYNGIKGERLRTIKLRGALSQGLILPLTVIPETFDEGVLLSNEDLYQEYEDITERLNIQKWEISVPAQLAGKMKGNFPDFIRKTDQERIQNIPLKQLQELASGHFFSVQEKLDGSSQTVYYHNNTWGVCSRNVDLKLDQEGNTFVDTFNKLRDRFEQLVQVLPHSFAIQGELIGPGIQGNQYGLQDYEFYVFDIWDIDQQYYLPPLDTIDLANHAGLKHVPLIHLTRIIKDPSVDSLLEMAKGTSQLNDSIREGLVFKTLDRSYSFKAINNDWLLKYD